MEPLEEHDLNVADTRPAMTWGLPHAYFVFFVFSGMIIAIWTPNLTYMIIYEAALFVFLPVAQQIVRLDYHGDRILMRWFRTQSLSPDALHWRGASPEAFPMAVSWRGRGIADV